MNYETSLKQIVISLIKSIDLVNYLLKDHHRRVAIISYSLGKAYGLEAFQLMNLVMAASVHDIGAISIKERDDLIKLDVENPIDHEIVGATMLSSFIYFSEISRIIRYHHIMWDFGKGANADNNPVPIECFLLHLADRIDILIDPNKNTLDQVIEIKAIINENEGKMFRPDCVQVFNELSIIDSFWLDIEYRTIDEILDDVMGDNLMIPTNLDNLEKLAYTFSKIVDFRSEFTATHSSGVAMVAYEIAKLLGLPAETCKKIKIAGFLHDIGKIGIPNEIIEKNDSLTESEFNLMKSHSYYTKLILSSIKGLDDIAKWASMHHEKHDGSGYPFHLEKDEFTIEMEVLAYADIFTALNEDRPYRDSLNSDEIIKIMEENYKDNLGAKTFNVVKDNINKLVRIRSLAQTQEFKDYQKVLHLH